MDSENVLDLFDGMTVTQAREFRKRIIPTLRELRETVIGTVDTEPRKTKATSEPTKPTRKRAAATRKGK